MSVTRPCYITRERVARATDIKFTARMYDAVDRAIESASESVDSLCHRRFYNIDATMYWDWPNFQRAYPWRLWLDEREIADITVNVPVVKSGTVTIPASQVFFGPWNYAPPYTFIELDRSTGASFGYSSTPQRDINITASYGYWLKNTVAGSLGSAVSSTSATTLTVTNAALIGVGDVLTIDSERMLAADRSMVTSGQSQIGAGCSTALNNDDSLTVTDGTQFFVNETILLDSERMLVVDIAGNTLIVTRAWDGTTLTTHTNATIYASRQITVTRGDFGTIAATHSSGAAISVNTPPSMVRDLSLAEAIVQTLEETGGYTGSQGSGDSKVKRIGQSLVIELGMSRDKVQGRYGRKARHRVI